MDALQDWFFWSWKIGDSPTNKWVRRKRRGVSPEVHTHGDSHDAASAAATHR
ncbi:hypothetical protein BD779DRAFT_1676651 [Infundibulicybe gibba]|nr:hypothetical protein BD779DRAFT_1676651 [Infundibulicybe gibba]